MQHDSIEAERRLFQWLANGVTTVRNMDYVPAGTTEVSYTSALASGL